MIKAPYSLRAIELSKQDRRWDKRLLKKWKQLQSFTRRVWDRHGNDILECAFYVAFWAFIFYALLWFGR